MDLVCRGWRKLSPSRCSYLYSRHVNQEMSPCSAAENKSRLLRYDSQYRYRNHASFNQSESPYPLLGINVAYSQLLLKFRLLNHVKWAAEYRWAVRAIRDKRMLPLDPGVPSYLIFKPWKS